MLIDFRAEDTALHDEGADVCIVGSGAAGLSLARQLLADGLYEYQESERLAAHPRLRVLLNATVTEVLLDPDATTVTGLRIATLDGRLGHVEGRTLMCPPPGASRIRG